MAQHSHTRLLFWLALAPRTRTAPVCTHSNPEQRECSHAGDAPLHRPASTMARTAQSLAETRFRPRWITRVALIFPDPIPARIPTRSTEFGILRRRATAEMVTGDNAATARVPNRPEPSDPEPTHEIRSAYRFTLDRTITIQRPRSV